MVSFASMTLQPQTIIEPVLCVSPKLNLSVPARLTKSTPESNGVISSPEHRLLDGLRLDGLHLGSGFKQW